MATVTEGQKFMGIASSMDTTEKKSANLNANTEFYTIQDLQSYTSEDLADGAAASLTKTMSYVVTGGSGETATLADGTDGQLKMFALYTDGGGNMVITVQNAGWKASGTGTITLADVGDGILLMYANGHWHCIGNNGAALA
jgi:hypothetical protein